MRETTNEEKTRADGLADIVIKRIGIKDKNQIHCPFEKSAMTPCIVRDGAICLIFSADGANCVGCGRSLKTVESKAKGGEVVEKKP